MIKRKPTLEQRIDRLERLSARKNEQSNEYAGLVWKTANNVHDSIQGMFDNLMNLS